MNTSIRRVVFLGLVLALTVPCMQMADSAEVSKQGNASAGSAPIGQQGAVVLGVPEDPAQAWTQLTLVKKISWPMKGETKSSPNPNMEQERVHPVVEVLAETMMSYKLVDDILIKDAAGNTLSPDQLRLPAEVKARSYAVQSGEIVLRELAVIHELPGATNKWEIKSPE